MTQPNGWCRRAEAAHRRRPWAGLGVAALVLAAGVAAATTAGAEEPVTTAAPVTTSTTAAHATTVTTAPAVSTTTAAAPVETTTTTTAPAPTETTLPSVALPTTTTTTPRSAQPAYVPGPGDPPAVSSACTPGYDPCIPPGSDVDCEGTGDGPRHERGPVYVEGSDSYGLDDDGDGVACP